MSTKTPILEHSGANRPHAPAPAQGADAPIARQRAAGRLGALVALIHDDLRARSAVANDLTKRSTVSISRTTEIIACSREAIARSRDLLARRAAPCGGIGGGVTDIDGSR